ncbi:MAG TPA: H-X9-DG-CTERM domain-containing protein [Planctomycetaceae bacterium]|jgi:hypothetical protein|nr:H-X9-DG-CTERM domain-containing protein [Planctomycetaceae bacterium]
MRRRWIVLSLIGSLGALMASVVATGWATPGENRPVETLLPADSVLYVGWVRTEHQREAWEKTAAFEALEKSGLVARLTKLALAVRGSTRNTDAAAIEELLESIARDGFSLSPGGVVIGMADGSVRVLSRKVDPKLFEALVTIHGGETVDRQQIERGR